ncbi:hypothetical protein MASR1M45_28040 [Candidatus Kapaibacterium sp.]
MTTKDFLALFEAISNSIHSIQDRNEKGQIKIEIEKEREIFQVANSENIPYIKNITIIDNGCGFNEENFKAFLHNDTTIKEARGGKGVGRFAWLKVFHHAEIDSIFNENGVYKRRKFKFCNSQKPIINHISEELADITEITTSVQLYNLHQQYHKKFPHDLSTLTYLLIEHNIQYLLGNTLPEILIYEKGNEKNQISVLNFFKNEVIINHYKDNFFLKNKEMDIQFDIDFIKQKKQGTKANHKIYYTAHERVVTNTDLSDLISDFKIPFKDDAGNEFNLSVVISSQFLNENVNEERNAFSIPIKRRNKNQLSTYEIFFDDVEEQITVKAKEYLKPFIEEIKKKRLETITELTNTKFVGYKPLLKYPEYLEDINVNQNENAIEIELYKVKNKIRLEAKTKLNNLISKDYNKIENLDEYKKEISEAITKYGIIGQTDLVNYIIHRKVIINILDKALYKQSDGKFALEELIHNIVFPMRTTSEDVEFEQQNLWLIDEKLSFHRYLASDIYLNKKSRPDILIDIPTIWIDRERQPYQNIVLIEFKKPNRDDYNFSESGSPYLELQKAINELKSGRAKEKGRNIDVDTDCRFFCYIIADITNSLKKVVIDSNDFKPMTDRMGYYRYHDSLKAYFEIIPYNKLLQDAQDRNRVLFEKLNLPENINGEY